MNFKGMTLKGLMSAAAEWLEGPKLIQGPRQLVEDPVYDAVFLRAAELVKESGQYEISIVRIGKFSLSSAFAGTENDSLANRIYEQVLDAGPVAEKDLPARFEALAKIHIKEEAPAGQGHHLRLVA